MSELSMPFRQRAAAALDDTFLRQALTIATTKFIDLRREAFDEFPEGGADHPGAKWDEWRELVAATLDGREPPAHPTHPIEIHPGSLLAEHLGERAVVNSYHHQAVKALGDGIRAVAWAPHGVAEAIEMPSATAFVLGVQWELHEEWRSDEATLGIWRAFVRAATRRSKDRDVVEVSG